MSFIQYLLSNASTQDLKGFHEDGLSCSCR